VNSLLLDDNKLSNTKLKVSHDFQRQILEITSLIRVVNYFYFKKTQIDYKNNKEDSLKTYFSDYKDSYKFPESTLLFEQWMKLGMDSLYPRLALHYIFPGFLKGEKIRNLFQFTFSTSRGFGFPIYFGPEFYGYILKYGKVLEPLFKWSHTVCHRANQAIFLFDTLFNINRHHLGEYESAIISEYKNGIFKGISTLLHGYFTRDPKTLGIYSSLGKALENLTFSYSVGDHAIKVETKTPDKVKYIPLISHQEIKESYNIDFYSYTLQLFFFQKLLIKKIIEYKKQKKSIISTLKWIEKIKFRINQSKYFSLKSLEKSENFINVDRCIKSIQLMEKLIDLIWITPLQSHTYHSLTHFELSSLDFNTYNPQEKVDSIFLVYIEYEENKKNFCFKESEVIQQIESMRDLMGEMWLKFRDYHINNALKELNKLDTPIYNNTLFKKNAIKYINKLIPIFSIYEIFNRPLSETIYPEATPERKRLGTFIARFFASRYNLFGVNLMRHFNNLAFNNWAYFIKKKRISLNHFFEFILKLPIWKYIPTEVKRKIIYNLNL
jgi:hypothetical protein